MYNLDNVPSDFPWTVVTYNAVEPWRTKGSNWFNELPTGWGDVTYTFLKVATYILERFDLKDYIIIEQVKEKWGEGRFYYTFVPFSENHEYIEFTDFQQQGMDIFQEVAFDWEYAVSNVCCDCGTTENVTCYGGWVHYACPECEKKHRKAYQE